ncbi:MAG: DegV family protein [Lachnospiraceae bacterium]|jgi:DegV family protein with EDD domain|nr:DegV family protein [Lachnospiraceae bacterium]
MRYKIVVDSCCELPEEYKNDPRFERVPLTLEVGDYQIQDDETFDQKDFLNRVAAYPKCPKSACPSPERYRDAYRAAAEHIYCVTLSSHLSGSYNSAVLGKHLYEEEYGKKDIYVCDSESASIGETQLAMKIMEWEEEGSMPFAQIVKKLETFRSAMSTYFVLDNLETLRKNGRLSGVKALIASTLSIKPVMGAIEGVIIQKGQSVGIKKALTKMADIIVSEGKDLNQKVLYISHCNCPDRADLVKKLLLARSKFKEVKILNTAGVSSMYANDGGVIVAI